ncbi:MAG TPA: TetR/AcrR family transcriptional regulator [Methylosinus sp.]|jgi:AcrR family transcriptional regulator|uniref:TetR/AcrR family transcriptional regulator n=1 Tax=Methylosinus sp. TaxID=427 RepID=UPI002F93F022
MSGSVAPAVARSAEQRARIVATAERLFRLMGFQKTTVADIARELGMSPANVYRFFSAKSEINAAVARLLTGEVEAVIDAIADGPGTAAERLLWLVETNEAMNRERYVDDRKLHDIVEAAMAEQWPIIGEHIAHIDAAIERVIASGMEAGEFRRGDAHLTARLVYSACIRYCHPRMQVECADPSAPSAAQMMAFCLTALRAGR